MSWSSTLNQAGREDTNSVQKRATLLVDTAPPTFAGIKTAAASSSGAVLLSWEPATDDHSAAAAMSYLVYLGASPSGEAFDRPVLITPPGATSALITGLVSPEVTRFFVVRARDAADNIDANKVEVAAQPSKDTRAPSFGGCTAAVTTSPSSVTVSWTVATDETTPRGQLAYDVFAATTSEGQDFAKPPAATATGTTGVSVQGLSQTTRYYFVCRARDLGGNAEGNRQERSATTTTDPGPPTFAGLSSSVVDAPARTVTLGWLPATDDLTLPQNIVYDVYEATGSHGQAFDAAPRASSARGATSVVVTNLAPDEDRFWVVRARDEGLNHDTNTVEATGRANVSFSLNVQRIFSHDCAVVGCHVPGNPTGNLVLTQGFSYASLVGAPAGEFPAMPYVAPGDLANSFLRAKLEPDAPRPVPFLGTLMPAPATGSVLTPKEIDTIKRWISQGAADN